MNWIFAKPETDLTKLKLVDGSPVSLMGAPEENQIKEEMQEERKFYEEMTPAERAAIYKEKTGVIPSISIAILKRFPKLKI